MTRTVHSVQPAGVVVLFLASTMVIALLSPQAILSLLILLGTVCALSVILNLSNVFETLNVAVIYIALCLILFLLQYSLLSEFQGASGPEGGIGTDDGYYYSLVNTWLPLDFPTREDYQFYSHRFAQIFKPYAELLRLVFGKAELLSFVIINLTPLVLTPLVVRRFARMIADEPTARAAFLLTLTCPFLMANGLIFVRDVWAAFAITLACLCAVERRFLLLLLVVALGFYVRVGTGILGLLGAVAFLCLKPVGDISVYGHRLAGYRISKSAPWLASAIGLALFVGLAAAISVLGMDTVSALIGRKDFVASFLARSAMQDGGTSTLYTIASQPIYISLPLGTLFFLGSPFFDINSIYFTGTASGYLLHGILVPRAILMGTYSLLFIFYIGFFFRGLLRSFSERNLAMITLTLFFISCVIILSQFSLVLRQKTAIQGVFYIIAAYGVGNRNRDALGLGYLAGVAVLLLNAFVTFRNVASL